MILGWIIVIVAAFLLLRWIASKWQLGKAGSESALDVLQKKYERGEISKEEYDRIRDSLQRRS
jgi:uncharacterized membrane protein